MRRGEKRKNQETEGGNLTYQMEEHGENLFLWWWHVDLTRNYTNFICTMLECIIFEIFWFK